MTETSFKYKDSNSEWIGKIPIEWSMATVRNGYEITLGKMVQPEPKSSTDVLVPYLKAMNVQDGYIKKEKIEEMYASRNELEVYKMNKGDLLVCEGGEVARSTIVEGEYDGYVFQNSVHRVKAKKDNSIEYLHYLLIALRNSGYINILVNKATIAHFTKDKFNSLKIPLPTAEEQKEIVLYVDEKEKEISRLINQKHQLITLLEEKRQSIITEAVTKGLNPNVIKKDSGVEWIGEIPEDWKIKKLKLISQRIGDGLHGTPLYDEDGLYYFVNGNNLGNKNINLKVDTNKVSQVEFEKYGNHLKEGSILISLNGTIGKISIYKNEKVMLSKSAGYINLKNIKESDFIYYYLQSQRIKNYFEQSFAGTTIKNLSLETLRNTSICMPSVEERKSIVNYLETELKKHDKLIDNVHSQIQKLKEYRQSLIYEAVTGKIDVRELVAEKQ